MEKQSGVTLLGADILSMANSDETMMATAEDGFISFCEP